MFLRRLACVFAITLLSLLTLLSALSAAPVGAQSGVRVRPSPTPDEEAETVYVEEVRLTSYPDTE